MNTVNVIQAVDKYFQLTKSIEMLTAEKKDLQAAILDFMSRKKHTRLEGKQAFVTLTHRRDAKIEPAKYFEAVGRDAKKLLAVCTIRMNPDPKTQRKGARDFLGNDAIERIAAFDTIPILSCKKLKTAEQDRTQQPGTMVG